MSDNHRPDDWKTLFQLEPVRLTERSREVISHGLRKLYPPAEPLDERLADLLDKLDRVHPDRQTD